MTSSRQTPIAVVGLGALFPGSSDLSGFLRHLIEARDGITDVPVTHWLAEDYYDPDPASPDHIYVKQGGFVPAVDFDPMAWGIPPSVLPATDSTQLLALVVAQAALEDAWRRRLSDLERDRISVILGVTSAQKLLGEMNSRLQHPVWAKALREMGLDEGQVAEAVGRIGDHYADWQENTFPGVLGNVVAGRIANRLDLGGTNCVIDAACASTFGAVAMAVDELALGHSDAVLCGGADTMNDPFMFHCFAKTTALSKRGQVRPFADGADGTMLGEGVGIVALMRLEDAEERGDPIYAVLRGVGRASDGRAKSVYAPRPSGQARALRRAYDAAGYGPDTVELLEAHGTGTAAGDLAEVAALTEVFADSGRTGEGWCALGSIKSQLGHTKAAAGAAGLIKAVLAVRHGVLPPTLNVETPNPELGLDDGPFYLSTETRPWIRGADHPRRAGVSAFGFGGSNFHVTVEEYAGPSRAPRVPADRAQLLVFSGGDADAVLEAAAAAAALAADDEGLRFAAWTSQRGFDASAPVRLAVVAESGADLAAKVALAEPSLRAGRPFKAPSGVVVGLGEPEAAAPVFLFPGQGSQAIGMGADLAMRFEAARAVWDRAASADLGLGTPIHELVFPRPVFDDDARRAQQARLTATERAQPALAVANAATLAVLTDLGLTPQATAGHSFGEVSALFAAGALDEAGLLGVAATRGRLMAEAAKTPGAMTAVRASRDGVAAWLETAELPLTIANHNHPQQVVLSGPVEAIEAAETALGDKGMRAVRLPVATAFHSPVVAGSTEPFRDALEGVEVGPLVVPVYANATAAAYGDVRDTLAGQLASPVRFVEMIEALHEAGGRTFVEVGPGRVLTGLVGRILDGREHRAVATDRPGDGVVGLLSALGELSAAGHELRFEALWDGEREPVDPAAKPKPKMVVPVSGANLGKPYPTSSGNPAKPSRPREREPEREPPRAAATAPRGAAPETVATPAPLAAAPREPAAPVQPARPTAPAHTAPVAAAPPSDGWLAAFRETQAQAAEAHAAFQRAMADSHAAYLRTTEAAMAGLAQLQGAALPAPSQPAYATPPPAEPVVHEPAYTSPPVVAPPPVVAAPPVAPPVLAPAPIPPAAPAPPAGEAPAPAGESLVDTLMAVVSGKTGYPTDLLAPHLELEADLGIDSIKRVEILAALKEMRPELPDLDPAHLGTLQTLGAIVDALGGAAEAPVPTPTQEPAATREPAATAARAGDLTDALLQVVSQKTGYPTDLLAPHLELEADLGIDSIKRVEILAALKEMRPELPDLDPAHLGTLQTLGAIVDALGGATASASATVESSAPAASGDLTDALLEVVSQKTGYPADLLAPHLELEADLGIDSIKRVEILAALKEMRPELPDLDPAHLGTLQTLGAIVDALQGAAPGRAPVVQPAAPVAEARTADRYVWTEREVEAPGLAAPGLFGRPVAVHDGGSGLAGPLVSALRAAGVDARDGGEHGALIDLGAASEAASWARAYPALAGVFDRARGLARRDDVVLYAPVWRKSGGAPWLSGVAGLARTARHEWPDADVVGIELRLDDASPATVAQRIADELLRGGGAPETILTAGGRRCRHLASADAPEPRLPPAPVVVASGGARGVTATCLAALADAVPGSRMLLLGRTSVPEVEDPALATIADEALGGALAARTSAPDLRAIRQEASALRTAREVRRTLASLRETGAEVRYASVDVADADAVRTALHDARAGWGAFTHLVHGAGALSDRRLADKRDDDLDRVVRPKLDGLESLLAATADDPLGSVMLFSSVAGHVGNVGQADYALANAALDGVAEAVQAARPNAVVRALGWGPWDGGMVTPALRDHFRAKGIALLSPQTGGKAFLAELGQPGPASVVLGHGASLGAPPPEVHRFGLRIDRARDAYLSDHTVEDHPVLPLVVVLDAFARAAQALQPALTVARVRDLAVLRGVRLERFEAGESFAIHARLLSNGSSATYALTLEDDRGPRYRAEVDLLVDAPVATPTEPLPALDPRDGALYGGSLFHGPAFQVIERLEGVGPDGAAGLLRGAVAMGWPERPWATDPALLDGGLQLAVLWTEVRLGGASLPTGLAALELHRGGPVAGPIRAVVHGRTAASGRAVCDILFVDLAGTPVATLRGVETHVRPSRLAERPPAR